MFESVSINKGAAKAVVASLVLAICLGISMYMSIMHNHAYATNEKFERNFAAIESRISGSTEKQAPQSAEGSSKDEGASTVTQAKAQTFKPVPKGRRIAVTSKTAKVFDGIDGDKRKVAEWKFGAKAKALEQSRDWCKVKKGKKTLYVKRNCAVLFNPKKKHCALTFDDGPSASTTPTVLKALMKNKTAATFFVVGQCINENSGKVLKKASRQGCEIGNHSYSHPMLSRMSKSAVISQVKRTDKKVKKYTGKKTTLMRMPYGDSSKAVLKLVGKPSILWSIDTLDWRYRNTSRLKSYVPANARDGSIILMHDIHATTVKAVDSICRQLNKKNFEMVTVTQLAAIKGKPLKAGATYSFIK